MRLTPRQKENQLKTLDQNIRYYERKLGQVIRKGNAEPDSIEARGRALLVQKYNRLKREAKERKKKLLKAETRKPSRQKA